MPIWQSLLWVAGGLVAVLLVSIMPGRMGRLLALLGVNAIAGVALLSIINLLAGYTALFVPLNGITLAVSSVLGIPGVAALAVLAAV